MKEIIDLIDRKVRPVLNLYHGDISRIQVTPEGIVKIGLTGPFSRCPSSQQTLAEFIEAVIKTECPQIKDVFLDCEVSQDLISEALGILRKGRQQSYA
ncbi:NifU family protein [Desulfosporosinus sp. PR]|uniref:NifU family protein n=1 Tax=Candidatus Desulfosporosinus nitrosoreducens TaxID=3401928 RepID=UPI0027F9A944|nr:NifU family protein [Desulfosporosinus sp. PR]MDQ7095616.1 NifU family protein [Desulfosporosinus sp. PR]